ncbi:hypothetical protein FQN50_000201 [Emmonsiellopsis sp. PD_5]|nr:hypothetical protein FQN50_000201 [Emmonsiellopsis sp. PD_5]
MKLPVALTAASIFLSIGAALPTQNNDTISGGDTPSGDAPGNPNVNLAAGGDAPSSDAPGNPNVNLAASGDDGNHPLVWDYSTGNVGRPGAAMTWPPIIMMNTLTAEMASLCPIAAGLGE